MEWLKKRKEKLWRAWRRSLGTMDRTVLWNELERYLHLGRDLSEKETLTMRMREEEAGGRKAPEKGNKLSYDVRRDINKGTINNHVNVQLSS